MTVLQFKIATLPESNTQPIFAESSAEFVSELPGLPTGGLICEIRFAMVVNDRAHSMIGCGLLVD